MSLDRGGRPHLSVVVPAYNEEARIGETLSAVLAYVEGAGLSSEILVVEDGSRDATARIADERLRGHRGRVIRLPENRGKGYAVRHGVLAAAGRWVLMHDADMSTPIEEHARLAAAARDRDLDVVIASRALPDSSIEVRQTLVRESMGKCFNLVLRLATGLPYRDTQCGFKLMDRRRVLPLFRRMIVDGFAFDVELLYLCHRLGLSVGEVAVTWRNSPDSRVKILRDPANMLFDVMRVRWRFRSGAYVDDEVASG